MPMPICIAYYGSIYPVRAVVTRAAQPVEYNVRGGELEIRVVTARGPAIKILA